MSNLYGVGLMSFAFAAADPLACLVELAPLLRNADRSKFCNNTQVLIRLKQLEKNGAPQYKFWRAIIDATRESPQARVEKFQQLFEALNSS